MFIDEKSDGFLYNPVSTLCMCRRVYMCVHGHVHVALCLYNVTLYSIQSMYVCLHTVHVLYSVHVVYLEGIGVCPVVYVGACFVQCAGCVKICP